MTFLDVLLFTLAMLLVAGVLSIAWLGRKQDEDNRKKDWRDG